jgi:REP-associated tyrosine transposase
MPRQARIVVPGLPLHAIQRGVNRAACFVDDEDRDFYLRHLGRLAGETGCALHAFCLMTNHVHLLLTPDAEHSCASLFQRLGLLYAQFMNRKHRRSGTLWEGRFRSCIVQSEIYLMACYRYVELNPVRAGMVGHPALYEWSSYGSNALGKQVPWILPHAEYLKLGTSDTERRKKYRALFGQIVDAGLVDEIRTVTNAGYTLGTKEFREDLSRRLGRRASMMPRGRPPAATPQGRAQDDLFR